VIRGRTYNPGRSHVDSAALMIEPTETESQGQRRPSLAVYVGRMRGGSSRPAVGRAPLPVVLLAMCAGFIGIFLISIPSLYSDLPASTKLFLIGSFGASAVLLYAAPKSEFAQPRNLLVGQAIAATIGVTAYKLFGGHVGVAGGLAVAATIGIMQITNAVHPPAGATALIAVLGPASVHKLGYLFVLTPVLTGAAILLLVAIVVNNLSPDENRHYPLRWW
jgi:CBS-domain-containing membrane protein